jgi:hypothetical protein
MNNRRSTKRIPSWARIPRRAAVQLSAVALGAAFAAAAGLSYSSANGSWQQAVREESRKSSLVQETVRAVYGDEGPAAFRIAVAQERAKTLRRVRETDPAIGAHPIVAAELAIADQLAFSLPQGALPGTLAAGKSYALPGGGFDVHRRLADLAPAHAPDPGRTAAEGDSQAQVGLLVTAATVLVTGTAVIAAAIPRRRRVEHPRRRKGRRRKPAAGAGEPELLPQPGTADRARRRTSAVLLALWAAGVLLPFAQITLGGEEQRNQAAAARTAVQLTAGTATSLARTAFQTGILREAITADAASTARELAAIEVSGPAADAERALARAEAVAAADLRDIAERMGSAPPAGNPASAALASTAADWTAAAGLQNAQADRAEVFGSLANDSIALIAILAAAGAAIEVFSHQRSATSRRR